jgi:two-component system sensor histidine kinase CreC
MPQQPAIVVLTVLFVVGLSATAWRVVRSRRHGLSIRLQVFLALASTAFVLAGVSFALVVRATGAGRAALTDVALELGVAVFVVALASAAAATFIGYLVARPLERLTHAAEEIAAGRRQAVLPVPRGREARVLTRAFESMRSELEQRHALERFAADLSHELKNPVAAILASAEVLHDAIGDDPTAARAFVERIAQAAARLERLTSELLLLARLEASGLGTEPRHAELAGVARAAAQAMHARAEATGVEVQLRAAPELEVRGDGVWLQRAIENLLANAILASEGRGPVRVEVVRERESAVVVVRDSGRGVPVPIRERLFERFVTTRHDAGGTGLGLAIVRAVAEAHGGAAELRATSDDGASFALVLPLAR